MLGTSDHLDHLLLGRITGNSSVATDAFNNITNTTSNSALTANIARGCAWLADVVCVPEVDPLSKPDPAWNVEHWEANVVGTVSYPQNVKAVLASFVAHYGTERGRQLRVWCAAHGWALVWEGCYDGDNGDGPLGRGCLSATNMSLSNRMLDLWVVHATANSTGTNVTKTPGGNLSLPTENSTGSVHRTHSSTTADVGIDIVNGTSQAMAWAMANSASSAVKKGAAFWRRIWTALQRSIPAAFVRPLQLYRCSDTDNCVGTQSGQGNHSDCVCF